MHTGSRQIQLYCTGALAETTSLCNTYACEPAFPTVRTLHVRYATSLRGYQQASLTVASQSRMRLVSTYKNLIWCGGQARRKSPSLTIGTVMHVHCTLRHPSGFKVTLWTILIKTLHRVQNLHAGGTAAMFGPKEHVPPRVAGE